MSANKLTADQQKHKENMQCALEKLRMGCFATRYKQEMSEEDEKIYMISRELAKRVLVKECESNVTDEELIEGLERYVENLG